MEPCNVHTTRNKTHNITININSNARHTNTTQEGKERKKERKKEKKKRGGASYDKTEVWLECYRVQLTVILRVVCYIMPSTVSVSPFQRKLLPPSSADKICSGYSGNWKYVGYVWRSKTLGQSWLWKYEGRWDFLTSQWQIWVPKYLFVININIYFCDILHFSAKLFGPFRYIFAV